MAHRRRLSVAIASIVLVGACGGASSTTGTGTPAPVAAASAARTPYPPPAQPSAEDTGGGYGDHYGYGTASPKAVLPTGPLQLVDTATLGKVLASSSGMTLYTNKNNTPKASACTGPCAQIWPPLLVTSSPPAAPSGLSGALGVVTWSDGTVQVTYNGRPVYLYAGDAKPGEASGDGVGGIWAAAKN